MAPQAHTSVEGTIVASVYTQKNLEIGDFFMFSLFFFSVSNNQCFHLNESSVLVMTQELTQWLGARVGYMGVTR